MQMAFAGRQVPEGRHAPMRQVRPVQQSVGPEHGSVAMRQLARQVPVGPQKPWQHWKSMVQAPPAMVHATGRHDPVTHWP